jgi:superfamily II DNA or RNA helicase
MLRQIDTWQSSILVAATGLGKTVMGAEVALQLHARGEIKRAILLSPGGNVQDEWCNQLDARDIPYKSFTNTILFHKNEDKNSLNQVSKLDRQLADADQNTLIIVDEAHVFRNQLLVSRRKGYNSRVIERIGTVVNEKKARIILLTATPYSTSVVNLNSLLALIPHWGAKNFWGEQEALSVKRVDEFVKLPMCTVIGLPHVIKLAQKRNDVDEGGRVFIDFPDRRRYMPKKLNLQAVHYQLPTDELFQIAWNANCFDQLKRARQWVIEEKSRNASDMFQATIDYIRNTAVDAWLSSPSALRIAVAKNLLTQDPKGTNEVLWSAVEITPSKNRDETSADDLLKDDKKPYKPFLKASLKERQAYLTPLLEGLKAIENCPESDSKLIALRDILIERCQNGGKALVFTTLHATASYLHRNLSEMLPDIRIDATVDGKSLKPMKERQRMQKMFAPKANRVDVIDEDDKLDVLIVTDADGVGVNLQDADTVISYDLPREADKIIQRVGRVLRPTEDREREIYLYVLYPLNDIPDPEMKNVMNKVMDRFNRVTHRHDSAQMILNAPVMPSDVVGHSQNSGQIIHLDSEVDINALLEKDGDILAQFISEGDTSRAIQHQAILEEPRNKERALNLGDNINSARYYDEKDVLVYALIFDGNAKRHVTLLYNQSQKEFLDKDDSEILDLLACDENTAPALAKTADVEKLVNRVIRKWCIEQEKRLDTIKKVCSLVLIPRDNNLRAFLESFLAEMDEFGPSN